MMCLKANHAGHKGAQISVLTPAAVENAWRSRCRSASGLPCDATASSSREGIIPHDTSNLVITTAL